MSQGEQPLANVILAEAVELASPLQPRPWGLWVTLAFSLAVIIAYVAIQTAVLLGFALVRLVQIPDPHALDIEAMAANGLLLSLSEWSAVPLCLALLALLVKLRRQLSIRDYLSLHRVPAKSLLAWAAILVVFLAVSQGTVWLLDVETSDFMVEAYRTAVILPLFWAAIVVAAPLFEEIFFRGFMFRGIQQSRLGNTGAVLITSLAWSMIHVQYDIYQVSVIFAGGILLGIARARSNSTYLTIALHSLWNTIAMIELEVGL